MDRSERARRLIESRRQYRELKAEVTRDLFLTEWLENTRKAKAEFDAQTYSQSDLDSHAIAAGFRSSRSLLEAQKDLLALHENFVQAEPFKRLWEHLKANRPHGDYVFGYSPARGGVPMRLIDAVVTWHQAPKFTTAERLQHSRKVLALCQQLEDLLSQVEPSHALDGQFSRFRFPDDEQAQSVARAFGCDPQSLRGSYGTSLDWAIGVRLSECDVHPLWAVRAIKDMAISGPMSNPLPSKIKSKSAKKTYFIGAVTHALALASSFGGVGVGPQLIADVVELMSGSDCTADDVRKARKPF